MDLDLKVDHQHLLCHHCEAVWCFQCIGRFEVKISKAWLDQARRAAKAHLN
jgi:hypothetical protein